MCAISGGRCAYTGCAEVLIVEKEGKRAFVGEIAHIISDKTTGPRQDSTYPPEKLHEPENLLVLCPTHHTEVDKLDSTWSPEELRLMKDQHESRVIGEKSWLPWTTKSFWMVSYVNVPRLLWLAGIFGAKVTFPTLEQTTTISRSGPIIKLLADVQELIGVIRAIAVPLDEAGSVKSVLPGTLIQFDERVRTRNLSGRDFGDEHVTGDIMKDPFVYLNCKANEKVMLPYDPKWITTVTAWSEFTSGTTQMAGICQAKGTQVRLSDRPTLVASPLVLGAPTPNVSFDE